MKLKNDVSIITYIVVFIVSGYTSWNIANPESFLGAIGFLFAWSIMFLIVSWLAVMVLGMISMNVDENLIVEKEESVSDIEKAYEKLQQNKHLFTSKTLIGVYSDTYKEKFGVNNHGIYCNLPYKPNGLRSELNFMIEHTLINYRNIVELVQSYFTDEEVDPATECLVCIALIREWQSQTSLNDHVYLTAIIDTIEYYNDGSKFYAEYHMKLGKKLQIV